MTWCKNCVTHQRCQDKEKCHAFFLFSHFFKVIYTKHICKWKHSVWYAVQMQVTHPHQLIKKGFNSVFWQLLYWKYNNRDNKTIPDCYAWNEENSILINVFFGTYKTALLNWDLSVYKNRLSISPTDEALPKHVQAVHRQRLAGQHVRCLQAGFTGVSTEPGADDGLVTSSGGHGAAGGHAAVPATWCQKKKKNTDTACKKILIYI